jgi:cysteine desulfurase
MIRPVYLDNAATTKVDPRVANVALHAMTETFGNPSSAHPLGAEASRILAHARRQVARAIDADAAEVYFTSGGTEANALGLLGAARARRDRHVVVSAFEHPSVADAARRLSEEGCEITIVAPTKTGILTPDALQKAIRPATAVCALIWIQNELGTEQPILELLRTARAISPRCHLHVDAVQCLGKIPISTRELPCDSLSLSAHKIHGPKGVGALFLRRGGRLAPLLFGGGQESGLRPGTEAVPSVAAFGMAAELAEEVRPEASARMRSLCDRLWRGLRELHAGVVRHGDPERAAPHLLSVGFPQTPAEPLLHALANQGIYASAGSACHAKQRRPSSALRAIGVPEHMGTLRFSLSPETTESDIERTIAAFPIALGDLQ